MSVLIISKFHGDTATFRQAVADRSEEFAAHGEAAQANGGIHHRFAVGAGFVVVIDEWESAEAYEKFMSNPELQAFIGTIGADANTPPQVIVGDAIESADQY